MKLSTFWIAATALPPIVMFENGVLCSVSFPYQSIASTDACPPSQLQLQRAREAKKTQVSLSSRPPRRARKRGVAALT